MSSPKLPNRSLTLPEGSPAEIDAELQAIADRLPPPEPEQGSHEPEHAGPPAPGNSPPVKAKAGPRSGRDQAGPRVFPAPRTLGARPADLPPEYGAPAVDLNALVAQAHGCIGNLDISLRRVAAALEQWREEHTRDLGVDIAGTLSRELQRHTAALNRTAAMAEARELREFVAPIPISFHGDTSEIGTAYRALLAGPLSSLPDQVAATVPGPRAADSAEGGRPGKLADRIAQLRADWQGYARDIAGDAGGAAAWLEAAAQLGDALDG